MFRVGQKVVCVDDELEPGCIRWGGVAPVKGQVYTVSGFGKALRGDELCLRLFELSTPAWCYLAHRFRPIVERKTDISIFTAMLDRVPADAGASS